jgi:DNA polymerase
MDIDEMRREIPRVLYHEVKTWAKCERCILAKTRRRLVYGSGHYGIPLFILGLSPGTEEDAAGVPFVGRSGKLLRETFAEIGGDVRNFFTTNLIGCHPPKNRTPQPSEVAVCRARFDRAIEILEPKIVLVLGAVALAASTGDLGITKARGRLTTGYTVREDETLGEYPAIGTYHPSGLLRSHSKAQLAEFRSDLELALSKAME